MECRYQQLIGGEWCDAANGGTWDVIDPATEDVVRTVPHGDGSDCRPAIEAAAKAFPSWSRRTAYERADVLMRAAALIRQRIEFLGRVNTSESGKPKAQGEGDWGAAAALFEWFAEEGKRAYGRTVPSRRADKRMIVLKQPLGVVGIITAWNFPAYNPSRAMAAALAAGCTVVVKPSEYTPLTAMLMVAILEEAGAPPGVVNLVSGDPEAIGAEMLENPVCRKIAFTGSVRVGKRLMDGASKTVTRLGLELGGNAPVIIFPDADIDALAEQSAVAKCRNTGQVCVSPQRFLVHRSASERFLEHAARRASALVVGPGSDPGTEVGPLINATQRERVEALVAEATGSGVEVLTGGGRPENLAKGFFYSPTVLSGVTPQNRLFQEEIFGPVMPVVSFDDLDEVIALANATEYGLAAYVWTSNIRTAARCWEGLEFGMVGINDWAPQALEAPFIGWKQSGLGAECGQEGLEDYLETKLVGIGGL